MKKFFLSLLFPVKLLGFILSSIIEYILTIHSSNILASWTRWIGTAVVASIVYFINYAVRHGLLSGGDLSAVLSALIGSISVIIAAGKVADGISGAEKVTASLPFFDKIKGLFKKQEAGDDRSKTE